jgi:hypothetical protein
MRKTVGAIESLLYRETMKSAEAEESPLLEAVIRERLVKNSRLEKD